MSWEEGDGKLCRLIREGRFACTCEDATKLASFQKLAASIRAFEAVGLVSNVGEHRESQTGHNYIDVVKWRNIPTVTTCDITSAQRRWLLLRYFKNVASNNASRLLSPDEDTFAGIAGTCDRIEHAGNWLRDREFIHWMTFLSSGGAGRILDKGYEALDHGLDMLSEGRMPIMNVVDQRNQSVNVRTLNAGAGDLAIGHNATINKQVLAEELAKLFEAIKQAPGDEVEKRTLLKQLKDLLAHPMVNTVTGGMLGGILS